MNLYEMFEQQEELTLIDALRDFLPVAINHLKLDRLPKIHLSRNLHDTHVPTFGRFENEEETVTVNIENRHPNDILRTLAHELVHYAQGTRGMLDSDSWQTGSPEEDEANAEAGVIMRQFNTDHPEYLKLGPVILPQQVNEKWSDKYKRSIDCSNPKGFSQRAHCQGRKKANEDTCATHKSPSGRMTNMCPDDDDYEINYGKDALDEGFVKNTALVAALASALASSPAVAEPNAAAQAIGIARKINIMKGYGAEGARAEAYQELYNLMKAVRGEGSNQSKIYPLVKDMINAPGPLPTEVEQLPPLTDQPTNENFADGKKPGRKGLAKRVGVDCSQSISKLRSIAKSSSGERQRMAHWCANMKSGKKK